jgi:nicotinamide-nucleotide amidase
MKRVICDMIKEIIDILKDREESITFAESCTGGRVASAFIAISGASAVVNGSCVTYSNEIKSKWLGVKEQTLIRYGAVSAECIKEMLDGIMKLANADSAIAISGVAGPNGGTEEKPVGTVYIGVRYLEKTLVKHYLFKGSREEIQNRATESGIELFKKIL